MLGDLLGSLPLKDISYGGIVILVIMMVLTDRLVTRKRLEEAREDGATWRATAERREEINRVQSDALTELLVLARATHHALTEIQLTGRKALEQTEAGL